MLKLKIKSKKLNLNCGLLYNKPTMETIKTIVEEQLVVPLVLHAQRQSIHAKQQLDSEELDIFARTCYIVTNDMLRPCYKRETLSTS